MEAISVMGAGDAIVGELGAGGLANRPIAGGITTGLEEDLEQLRVVKYYPNPFRESILLKSDGIFTYAVYDLTGHEMEYGEVENEKFIGSDFSIEMYLVKINFQNESKILKVTKEK